MNERKEFLIHTCSTGGINAFKSTFPCNLFAILFNTHLSAIFFICQVITRNMFDNFIVQIAEANADRCCIRTNLCGVKISNKWDRKPDAVALTRSGTVLNFLGGTDPSSLQNDSGKPGSRREWYHTSVGNTYRAQLYLVCPGKETFLSAKRTGQIALELT